MADQQIWDARKGEVDEEAVTVVAVPLRERVPPRKEQVDEKKSDVAKKGEDA